MNKSINFYILNRSNKAVAVLSTEEVGDHLPVISAKVEEKLSSYDILTLSIPADAEGSELVKEEYTIIFEDIKGWREYVITEIEEVDGDNVTKTITAELSSVELLDEIIETELTGYKDPTVLLTTILNKTRWSVGTVDASIYNSTFSESVQYKSVLEIIDLMSSAFNCEVSFSYTIDQNKVAKRFVNLSKQVGSDKGKRFEVDKDVTEITRTVDTTGIKTAIIPYGKEPSEATEGETQAKRLDIKNVVWTTANGNPVNKPKGQSWIGDAQALANWGKLQADGTRRHRFIAMEIDTETEAELATMAWVNLGKYTDPSVTYEAKVMDLYTLTGDEEFRHEHVFIGDTVAVIDNYFADPITVKSRVVELVRDLIEPLNNEVVLGDAKQTFKVGNVEKAVEELATQVAKANYNATNAVVNGAGNTTFYGSVAPVDPDKGDTWFRPHPEKPNETQLVIYNGTVWEVVADTSELEEVKGEVQEAILDVEKAKQSADNAVATAGIAVETANQAVKNADDKIAVLEGDLADKLDIDTFDTAKALQDAELAKKVAITTYIAKVGELNTAISGHSTRIEKTEKELLSKASSTDVDAVKGRLSTAESTITQQAGMIASKVSSTELDAVKGRLGTAESSITQQAGQIASKVSTTDFNTVKGRVATAESSISQQANEIASRVTKTELTNAVNGIEIGGRNLLGGFEKKSYSKNGINFTVNADGSLSFYGTKNSSVTDFYLLGSWGDTKELPDRRLSAGTYTLSSTKNSGRVSLKIYQGSKNIVTLSNNSPLTFTVPVDTYYSVVYLTIEDTNYFGGEINFKLEKGTKATDWTPAIEDVETRLSTAESSITQQATQIASKVATADFNAVKKRVETAESSITQQAGLIASKVTQTEIDKSIDGLKIGGRNLVIRHDELSGWLSSPDGVYAPNSLYGTMNTIIKVTPGETLYFTKKTVSNATHWRWNLYDINVNYVTRWVDDVNSFSWKVPNDIYSIKVSYPKESQPKIERGNKATDWSPAPEDVDTRLTTAESSITQQAGLIQAKVSTADYNSKISQLDSAIQSKVASATYNSKMTQLDNSITSVVTDLGNLPIEGRNYFNPVINVPERTGGGTFETNNNVPYGFYVVGDQSQTLQVRLPKVITGNGLWTVSFDLKGSQNGGGFMNVDICDLGRTSIRTPINNEYGRVSLTVNVTNYGDGSVYNFVDFKPTWSYVWVKNIKVEKGGKETGFTPAPEDMATVSQITQLSDQISSKVESSAYATKMTQLDSAINLRVVAKDVTDAILSDKTIKDTRDDNQIPYWYLENYPRQEVREFKRRTAIGLQGSSTYVQLTTKVPWAGGTSGGVPIQIAESNDGVYQRVSSSSAGSWLAWDKVAEAGKLISQINVSTEGILLQGKRIQLDGDVTMTTAFISKIKAIEITADKITGGTFNGANMNIVNLNANAITSGTLSGGAFSLNLSTGKMEITGTAQTVKIDSGGMTMLNNKGQEVGALITAYSTSNPTVDNGLLIGVKMGKPFTIGRQSVSGSTSYTDLIKIPYDKDIIDLNVPVSSISIGKEQYKLYISTDNKLFYNAEYAHQFNHFDWGTKNLSSILRLSLKSAESWATWDFNGYALNNTGTISGTKVSVNNVVARDSLKIDGGSGKHLDMYFSRELWIGAEYGIVLAHQNSEGVNNSVMTFTSSGIKSWQNINMQGYSVSNQSDKRLKKNVETATVDAIGAIKRWKFVDYEWIDIEKPAGKQFGLIAQDTPELIMYDEKEDIYSIDSSKQLMLTGLAVQQVGKRLDHTVKDVSTHTVELQELKTLVETLQQEITKLKGTV